MSRITPRPDGRPEYYIVITIVPALPDQSAAFRFPENAESVAMLMPVEDVIAEGGESAKFIGQVKYAMWRLVKGIVEPEYVTPPLPPDILDQVRAGLKDEL